MYLRCVQTTYLDKIKSCSILDYICMRIANFGEIHLVSVMGHCKNVLIIVENLTVMYHVCLMSYI